MQTAASVFMATGEDPTAKPDLRRASGAGGVGRVGEAIARRLEREGWSVLAAGRADGDVSRPEEARALVERAAREFGGLDLLVNAAGEGFKPKPVEELTEADWD